MQERAFENPKITFLWNTVVEDLPGPAAGQVMMVRLRNVKNLHADGRAGRRPVRGDRASA